MKYFVAEATPKYYQPELKNWYNILNPRLVSQCRYDEIPHSVAFKVESNPRTFVSDVISFPYFMITYEAEGIINKYDSAFRSCRIHLFDKENRSSKLLLLPLLEPMDCLTQDTIYNRNRSDVLQPVLSIRKTEGLQLLRPKGFSLKKTVIGLDLAESLLRRQIRGLSLTEIKLSD